HRGGARRDDLGALRARWWNDVPDRVARRRGGGGPLPPPRLTAPPRGGGTLFVLDDDGALRRGPERPLRTAGVPVAGFEAPPEYPQDYLDRAPPAAIGCIVTDVRMPGPSGLDLQAALARTTRELPMVFITGHGDVRTGVRAMRAGAVNFLPKPFAEREILAAV